MALQSNEEILRIADEWIRNFRPTNLVPSTMNAELILAQCLKASGGVISISGMTEAAHAIAAQLELYPEAKAKTAEQLAQEEIAKQNRDYMESIKPQESFEQKVAKDKTKRQADEKVKAQEDAKGQLELAITAYQCYRTNGSGIDHTMTEAMKAELRTVKCGNDTIRTLAAVKAVIEQLPDHPQIGDVARTVEIINARLRQ